MSVDRSILVPSSGIDILEVSELFGEQVCSQLGYVATESREETTCNGIMMDEEWIVGINVRLYSYPVPGKPTYFDDDIQDTTHSDGKFSLEVWHLG
jgi:hypothetical protein